MKDQFKAIRDKDRAASINDLDMKKRFKKAQSQFKSVDLKTR